MKFGFIAKHRGIWPTRWLCEALGVSRGGYYAWLTRPRSQRSRSDEELSAKVRASFLASDRTYGARRVWHDLLAEGVSCGLHQIERLMRLQALKARPRRRRMQIREPELEVCLVVLPRQPVYTGRGVPFQLKEREPKEINADVVEERGGEPFLLPIAGETERPAMALFHHDTPLGACPSNRFDRF